jgi:uncharacterized protein YjbI with pentapeptide repeats
VSADIVGSCRENERPNPYNGNVEQLTANGLLYWRACDNITGFTDGNVTWINGPVGLQNRLSTDAPFDWEPISACVVGRPSTPEAPVAPAPAPLAPAPTPIPTPPAPVIPIWPTPEPCPLNTVNIRNGDLSNLDRRGVNYMCADAYHAKFAGADFSAANLAQATLEGADVSRVIFYGARMTLAVLRSTTGGGTNFGGADMRGAKLSTAKLPNSDFRYADLNSADLSRAVVSGSDLRGADLRGADLSQSNFSGANLTGANLCGADITGTNFSKAIGVVTSCG